MKPTVDSILAKYNIRPYNGSWYVQEKKLREVLEQVIEELYGQDIPFIDEIVGNLIRKGGGRSKRMEYTWFWLREEELK